MILDVLENASRYPVLQKGFEKAVGFILRPDLKELPEGKYEIDGQRVFAMVSKSPGRAKEDAQIETHKKYIDIQLVLAGTDTMGWKPKALCMQPTGEYDPQADIQFFDDEPDAWITVKPGAFAVFFPEDAHMPMISEGPIHKVVIKVEAFPEQGA